MAPGGVTGIGFTGARIDRADHLRLDEARVAELLASDDARLLALSGVDELGRLPVRLPGDAEADDLVFLGLRDGAPLFVALNQQVDLSDPRRLFEPIASMRPEDSALWGAALSLIQWHGRHRFCGTCGAPTAAFRAGWGRRCCGCGVQHFPRVDPVVIMLVEHEGRVLLARQPRYPPRRYSALAGFVEPGESIEEAVAREVEEEAGLQVVSVRYAASQPWPFPGQLMIGCFAAAASDELRLDSTELEHGFWARRDEVATALAGDASARFLPPPPFAIAHSLLTLWLTEG